MRIVLGILQLKSWIFLKIVTLMAELVVQVYGGIIGSSTFSVMAGGRIELPCDINTTSSEGDLSLILWHKDQSRVPIYSIDVRNTSLAYARHFPSLNISTKSYFNVSDNPAVLSLERLEKTDEGLYRCRVEYKRSRTETSESLLKVLVPPKEAIIMDEYGQHLHGMIGPYNEGFPLALACEGEGGDPSPAVRWWRDAELLDDSYYITPQGFARNELLLSSLRRTDLLTKLTCQVSNSNLTEPVTSSVIIDMNLKPTDVRITSMYRPISVERFTEIVCVASGARPPAQISWWLDGEKLTSRITESTVRDENLTVSSLLFGPTKHDNQRNLSCRGDNPQVPDSVLEDTWILDIHFPPQLSVKVDKESAIQEGDSINMTCVVQANPPIVELEWLKDSQSLGPTSKKSTRSRILHISNVTSEQKGRYQCVATNSEGKSVSEPVLLKVQYVPRCVSVRSSIYGVGQTESVSVACEVDASPSTVSFTWALDGAKILSTEQYSSNGSHSVATISPRSPKDYGLLMCWASNAVGRQREPCTFRIIPAGPPEEPRNCLISNRTTHCLVLECEMGHDGGLTQLFQLEIFGTDSDKFLSNVTAHSAPKFTVCSLPSRESLVLIVYSLNNKGRSKQITMHVSSTESNEAEEEDSGALEALVGVLIGALGVLILLAVTVTLLVCLQRKKRSKKGRAYPDEEKSDPQLSKECKEPCVASSYGPDIIPEKSFYRERSSSLINVIEVEQGINPSSAQSDPSSRKYREYDAFSYPEGPGIHATPKKLSMLQTEEESKETDLQSIVETPLISSIHPTLHQWPNSKKETTIRMSTPV